MGQNAIPVQVQGIGGNNSSLNITAAAVVKGGPGYIYRIIVSAPGSGGSNLTVNDATIVGGASAANQILTVPAANLAVGQVITLECPCKNGIVISSVPGGSPIYAVTYS